MINLQKRINELNLRVKKYTEYNQVLLHLKSSYPNIYLDDIIYNELYFKNRGKGKLPYTSYKFEVSKWRIDVDLFLKLKLDKNISKKKIIIHTGFHKIINFNNNNYKINSKQLSRLILLLENNNNINIKMFLTEIVKKYYDSFDTPFLKNSVLNYKNNKILDEYKLDKILNLYKNF